MCSTEDYDEVLVTLGMGLDHFAEDLGDLISQDPEEECPICGAFAVDRDGYCVLCERFVTDGNGHLLTDEGGNTYADY